MDARGKEIRKIISGMVTNEGSKIVASDTIFDLNYQGMYAGTLAARVNGLTEKRRQYRLKLRNYEVRPAVEKALEKVGKPAALRTAPDAMCALCFPILHNPCFLTAEYNGRDVLVCFYTARTLFSFLNAARGFAALERKLGKENLTRVKVTEEPKVTEPEETN